MAVAAPNRFLDQLRREPLRGGYLVAAVLIVWLAGALYCSGYERLLSGIDNWPGSLLWSAIAILPWLALFEWSKTETGARCAATAGKLFLLLVGTAIASVLLELAMDWLTGSRSSPIALIMLRRLPGIGVCVLLLLWSRGIAHRHGVPAPAPDLAGLAASIDWIRAADNYVELHLGDRVVMRRITMREAQAALAVHGFVRIHRSYLVNTARVAAVTSNGERMVRLRNGAELPVGRRYAANLHRLNFATSPQSR